MSRRLSVRPLHVVVAAMLGFALACAGDLVSSQAFDASGRVSWTTTVPQGDASLWLDYAIDAPSKKGDFGEDHEPDYAFMGKLTVSSGQNTVYDGPLNLSPSGSPVAGRGSSTRMGGSETCNSTRCSATGRIKLIDLKGLKPGDPLSVRAQVPTRSDNATASLLSLQIYQR